MKTKILILCAALLIGTTTYQLEKEPLRYSVKLDVVTKHWDGNSNWAQPRVGVIPKTEDDENPVLVITMQKWFVESSDFYSGLYTMRSENMGTTWSEPEEHPELGWRIKKGNIIFGNLRFCSGMASAIG